MQESMQEERDYWRTTLIRGGISILAGSGVVIVPEMAETVLLLPMAVVLSVLGLAIYGVMDSILVFVSSFKARSLRTALRLQGAVGVLIGALLFSLALNRVQMEWFLSLAAAQALAAGVAEIVVARHAQRPALGLWSYAASCVAFCFGGTYLVLRVGYGDALAPATIARLVFAYLLTFGAAQCINAIRMLWASHQPSTLGKGRLAEAHSA